MEEVGIRELKQRASEIVRRVREQGETYAITYRGRIVARVVPVESPELQKEKASAVWAGMDELAREISAKSASEVSAVEAVAEQRREL